MHSTEQATTGKLALSVNEAAHATGLGRSTLHEIMAAGKLAYTKVGQRRLIMVDDLRAMLAAGRTVETGKGSA